MQNPLEAYRRTQRELRQRFDAFTRENCPDCPTPCCRQPARIAPTDILLAEATGWRARLPADETADRSAPKPAPDMIRVTAVRMAEALAADSAEDSAEDSTEKQESAAAGLPCEFLGPAGCGFPPDLRPFGCTTYLCRYMYARLDRPALTRIKRLVRELEERHRTLMHAVRSGQGKTWS